MTRILLLLGLFLATIADATLNPGGTKCGQKLCKTTEYCSPYDTHCRPCSDVCDPSTRNYEPELCVKNCQEYLHDQRYVLRTDLGLDGNLRDEINKLWTLLKISLALTIISIFLALGALSTRFVKVKKIRGAFEKVFGKKWAKSTSNGNKVRAEVEVAPAKQNVIKVTMPTISGSVTPYESTNGNSTMNTTSTPLSRRCPTEDKTLDYAYDNPAMTPSPETAQPRTKRESSF